MRTLPGFRALLPLTLAWLLPFPAAGQGPDGACSDDFAALVAVVRADYAGFRHKAEEGASRLAALSDSVRGVASAGTETAACTEALQRWVAFFGDPHLRLREHRPEGEPAEGSGAAGESGDGVPTSVDPNRPSLRFLDDSTAVLALPDFGDRYAAAIDSLVRAHRTRILSTPRLIVDVRGNAGGWTGSYESVLPLLYTDPILVHGMEFWASDGNLAYLRRLLASDRAEGIKRRIRAFLPEAEAGRGGFVPLAEDRTIRMETVHAMPRSVAVLVGRGCASTCEQFVLDVRQSEKITIVGRDNTGGFLDYGNARRVPLPSGERSVQVPTTRSTRLPDNPLDEVGIAPDVLIPRDHSDPLGFTRAFLRSSPEGACLSARCGDPGP